MPTRVLIADDHGVLRAGLIALLSAQPELEVVGEAADGDEALRRAIELRPDLVLLDLTMPGLDGIEVTRQLREVLPEVRILILTFHEEASLFQEAMRSGAAGYVVKRAIPDELLDAIQAVSRGELYVHPAMTEALLKNLSPLFASKEAPASLTPREIEVLRLLIEGHTNRQIATILGVSVRTVDSHRANLRAKLNLHDRADLMRYAKEHHLL